MYNSRYTLVIAILLCLLSCRPENKQCIKTKIEPAPIVMADYHFSVCEDVSSVTWYWGDTATNSSEIQINPKVPGLIELSALVCDTKDCEVVSIRSSVKRLLIGEVSIDSVYGFDTSRLSNIQSRLYLNNLLVATTENPKYIGELNISTDSLPKGFSIDFQSPISLTLASDFYRHNLNGNPYLKGIAEFHATPFFMDFSKTNQSISFQNDSTTLFTTVKFSLLDG